MVPRLLQHMGEQEPSKNKRLGKFHTASFFRPGTFREGNDGDNEIA